MRPSSGAETLELSEASNCFNTRPATQLSAPGHGRTPAGAVAKALCLRLAACFGFLVAVLVHASELKSDERVVLYPALAAQTSKGWNWICTALSSSLSVVGC